MGGALGPFIVLIGFGFAHSVFREGGHRTLGTGQRPVPGPGLWPSVGRDGIRPWLGSAELPKLFLKCFWFNKALNKFCQALFPLIFKPE